MLPLPLRRLLADWQAIPSSTYRLGALGMLAVCETLATFDACIRLSYGDWLGFGVFMVLTVLIAVIGYCLTRSAS